MHHLQCFDLPLSHCLEEQVKGLSLYAEGRFGMIQELGKSLSSAMYNNGHTAKPTPDLIFDSSYGNLLQLTFCFNVSPTLPFIYEVML